MKYLHLLFDVDDTLFDFPKASARAFSEMCQRNRIPETPGLYQFYHNINLSLWAAFDRGEVTKDFVVLERYVRLFRELDIQRDPAQCNRDYLEVLGNTLYPLPHAEAVCRELFRRGHKLYLVTNAVASVQKSRLSICPFADVFTASFISEEAGASKPQKAYYDYVQSRVPGLSRENTLVIGDSLSTDMEGANRAELPCCWFNPTQRAKPDGLRIDYTISDLRQLLEIV